MTNPKAAPAPNKVAMPGLHDAGERLSADIQRAGIALANLGVPETPCWPGALHASLTLLRRRQLERSGSPVLFRKRSTSR